MAEHQPVDWDAVKAFADDIKRSPESVQRALEEDRLRWNDLLHEINVIAKDGGAYDGETSEELLALLRDRIEDAYQDGYRDGRADEHQSLADSS